MASTSHCPHGLLRATCPRCRAEAASDKTLASIPDDRPADSTLAVADDDTEHSTLPPESVRGDGTLALERTPRATDDRTLADDPDAARLLDRDQTLVTAGEDDSVKENTILEAGDDDDASLPLPASDRTMAEVGGALPSDGTVHVDADEHSLRDGTVLPQLDEDDRTVPGEESGSDGTLAVDGASPRHEAIDDGDTFPLPANGGSDRAGATVVRPDIAAFVPQPSNAGPSANVPPSLAGVDRHATRPPEESATGPLSGVSASATPGPVPVTNFDVDDWHHSRAPSLAPMQGETLASPVADVHDASTAPAPDKQPTNKRVDQPTNAAGSGGPPNVGFSASSTPVSGSTVKVKPQSVSFPPVPGYEILQELGRGGMGVVYKARHIKLNRIVALKMILAGARASRTEMARFHGEAQVIAQLRHPNIVQVYEIAECDGKPYFSLEFVEGGTLEDKADRTPQEPRHAARIIEQLAGAMELAHQSGILHRDLKPANVLLEGAAAAPLDQCVPKITDFGLAKRLEGDSGHTRDGSVMGTPSYMSPEQAQGKIKELGPGADVYSLGAILYDLLTGKPPFKGPTVMETLRQVIHNEPVPPTSLQPALPRDMQIICMKCLDKDPKKRYPRAGALADDLRRFLDGLPIEARATPAWERAWKWTRRYPAKAGLVAVSVLLMLGLATGGMVYARIESQRKDTAIHAQKAAEDRAEAEQKRAEAEAKAKNVERVAKEEERRLKEEEHKARTLAESSLQQARDAIEELAKVGNDRLARVPYLEAERRAILKTVLRFHDDFVRLHKDNPALRADRALHLFQAGSIHENLGDYEEAEKSFDAARQLDEDLLREPNASIVNRQELARTWNELGVVREKLGHIEAAEKAFANALELKAELVDKLGNTAKRDLAASYNNRGTLYQERKRPADAEKDFRAAVNLLEPLATMDGATVDDKEALVRAYRNLAVILTRDNPKEADGYYEKAMPLCVELCKNAADDPRFREQTGLTYLDRAALRIRQKRPVEEIVPDYQAAVVLFEELARQFRAVPDHRQNLVSTLIMLGDLRMRQNKPVDAEKAFRRAVPVLVDLVKDKPKDRSLREILGKACNWWGIALVKTGQHDEAEKTWRDGLAVHEKLLQEDAANPGYWTAVWETTRNIASMRFEKAQWDEAEEAIRNLIKVQDRRIKVFPMDTTCQGELANSWDWLREVQVKRRKPAEARQAQENAVAVQRRVWDVMKQVPDPRHKLADRQALTDYSLALIQLCLSQGDHKAAAAAVATLQKDVPPDGKLPAALSDRDAAVFYVQCFTAAKKDVAAQDEYVTKAVESLRRMSPEKRRELKTAGEFLPVREREEFKKLLTEVER